MKSYIIAVDFDGTLCEDKFPDIGSPNREVIDYLKKRQLAGAKLILWTCRIDESLDNAVRWCRNQGLIFNAVNENLPEIIAEFGTDTRKILADEYIDDKNVWIPGNEYDTLVCTAVRNNPYEFVDILREAAKCCYGSKENPNHYSLLLEASCVIANLLKSRNISKPEMEADSDE